MTDRRHAPSALVIAAFAAVYILWGSTYLAIKYAVQTLPPFLLAGARFTFAGAVLSAFTLARGAERPSRANWKAASIVGILLFPLGNGIVVWAETRVDSGMAALLVATEPFWIVLLLWLRAGVRPRPLVIAGIVAGFAGLFILVGRSPVPGARADVFAAAMLVGASFSWAAGSLYARSAALPRAPLLSAGMQMIAGGLGLLAMGAVGGELSTLNIHAVSTASIVGLVYLIIFGSFVGFSAYSWLVSVVSPARVATYAYVNPVIAVILGWAIAGEPITWRLAVAAAVIIGAVVLIIADQGRTAAEIRRTAERLATGGLDAERSRERRRSA